MNGVPSSFGGANLIIEGTVAIVVAVVFLLRSFIGLRGDLLDVDPWHVHVGAGIYGALFGVIVGFVIVPARMLLSGGQVPPQVAGWAGIGFFAVMFALRRGLIGRLPFLGPQVRAYRRASLRRSILVSKRQLEKLEKKADIAPASAEGAAQ